MKSGFYWESDLCTLFIIYPDGGHIFWDDGYDEFMGPCDCNLDFVSLHFIGNL